MDRLCRTKSAIHALRNHNNSVKHGEERIKLNKNFLNINPKLRFYILYVLISLKFPFTETVNYVLFVIIFQKYFVFFNKTVRKIQYKLLQTQ